jgi:hypothetical protein
MAQQQKGTHGHRYDPIIDGDLAITNRDRRVLRKHKHARSNVRGPLGSRSYPFGSALPEILPRQNLVWKLLFQTT